MPNLSPDPPPPTEAAGDMDNGVSANAPATEITITEVALSVLQSVLSVL